MQFFVHKLPVCPATWFTLFPFSEPICAMSTINKKKIINDPVHGFISIRYPLIFDLLEHAYFQRLRHIKQLGLTYLVYPGATHSRLQHALGTMHLLDNALATLRDKGHAVTEREAEAACAAILLHDIGHGPYSHALEYSIARGVDHETISRCFIHRLNRILNGRLALALDIFEGRYHKKFLHQLISGQLDMDRMDYLKRDSFFTGVSEGTIGSDRIIKMLNVVDDNLVVEAKGIYSIEKFLIARRLMYWQVYLHKTVVAAEQTLIKMLSRAKELAELGKVPEASEPLRFFLSNPIEAEHFTEEPASSGEDALSYFARLDDTDIMVAAKTWIRSDDEVLARLAGMVADRKIFGIELSSSPIPDKRIREIRVRFLRLYPSLKPYAHYFVFSDTVSIKAYQPGYESIKILYHNNRLVDLAEASDMLNANALSYETKKYFLCYPKELR